jgi:hypothetical protein
VRAVEIPKPHGGGARVLGVPTVADRVYVFSLRRGPSLVGATGRW